MLYKNRKKLDYEEGLQKTYETSKIISHFMHNSYFALRWIN